MGLTEKEIKDADKINTFVDEELAKITAKRKGLRTETRTIAKQVEYGAFFAAGDCCTNDQNT